MICAWRCPVMESRPRAFVAEDATDRVHDLAAVPELLSAYLPRPVALLARSLPVERLAGSERRFPAAALVADIAGFTPLAEALASQGRDGVEQLAGLLDELFGGIVREVERHGGVAGRFGGDAVSAFFPAPDGDLQRARGAAVRCAQAIREARRTVREPSGHRVTLRLGVGAGEARALVLGDHEARLDYVLTGSALLAAFASQARARPGAVVVDSPRACAGPPLVRQRPLTVDDALVARFLHPGFALRVQAGLGAFIAEHRRVSVAFVSLGASLRVEDLQARVAALSREIADLDGHLHQLELADKGAVAIAVFGAPVSHEDDSERVALLAQAAGEIAPDARAGAATGRVFCCELGSSGRREYTLTGDTMNLAARLLALARPGEALVDEATAMGARSAIAGGRVRIVRIKGKAAPVRVRPLRRRVAAPAESTASRSPLVGRARELRVADAILERVLAGAGASLELAGDAGIGKSRLAAEIADRALAQAFRVHAGAARATAGALPYGVWRQPLRSLLELEPGADAAVTTARLEELVPSSAERAPLLAAAVGIGPFVDSPLMLGLDARQRADALRSLVVEIVERAASRAPRLLLLEDLHWADGASLVLLRSLQERSGASQIALVTTSRTLIGSARTEPGSARIRLRPLRPAALGTLVRRTFANADEPIIEAIQARAQGNPLFALELGRLAGEAGGLAGVPDNVEAVVRARVDRVPERERAVLAVASVAGRRFRSTWLAAAQPALGGEEGVSRSLGELARRELVLPVAGEPGAFRFGHALVRDAVYGALPRATRIRLHDRVGRALERDRDADVELLAHHFSFGRDVARKRRYLRAAGDLARAAFANESALGHYEALLPLVRAGEQRRVLEAIAQIQQHTGDWDRARATYERARSGARGAERVAIETGLGQLIGLTGRYDEARVLLQSARRRAERIGDEQLLLRVIESDGLAAHMCGALDAASEAADELLLRARGPQMRRALARGFGLRGAVATRRGSAVEVLRASTRGMRLAEAIGDRAILLQCASDAAVGYGMAGRTRECIGALQTALSAALEIGDRRISAVILVNASELEREWGSASRARRYATLALRELCSLGDRPVAASALLNLSLAAGSRGLPGGARGFEAVRVAARALGDRDLEADVMAAIAERELAGRRPLATRTVPDDASARSLSLRVRSDVLRGAVDGQSAARTLTEAAQVRDGDDRAELLFRAALLDPTQARRRRAASATLGCFRRSQRHVYRRRLRTLTGSSPPRPPALPLLRLSQAVAVDEARVIADAIALVGGRRKPSSHEPLSTSS